MTTSSRVLKALIISSRPRCVPVATRVTMGAAPTFGQPASLCGDFCFSLCPFCTRPVGLRGLGVICMLLLLLAKAAGSARFA